jgi:hypothetical protein
MTTQNSGVKMRIHMRGAHEASVVRARDRPSGHCPARGPIIPRQHGRTKQRSPAPAGRTAIGGSVYDTGIAPAAFKKALKKVEVTVTKRGKRSK